MFLRQQMLSRTPPQLPLLNAFYPFDPIFQITKATAQKRGISSGNSVNSDGYDRLVELLAYQSLSQASVSTTNVWIPNTTARVLGKRISV